MISHRMRESRRVRALKLPKNIERIYKQVKCRECTVVVKRMDFAKILGKFTKVKIQYESTPKTKKNTEISSPNSNARLKSNENGMVLIHRNAYNQHPVKELQSSTKKVQTYQGATSKPAPNVLKENNRLKKTPLFKDKNSNINISSSNKSTPLQSGKKKEINTVHGKQYGIIFDKPSSKNTNITKSKISLLELLPLVDKSILPTQDWHIDYLPRNMEPTDDKVYDRIAAELEDLMYNEHPAKEEAKSNTLESKVDDFPSIMDILNDNTSEDSKSNNQSTAIEFKTSLESSDVEAMLLGESDTRSKELEPTAMDVDNSVMSNLIEDVAQLNAINTTSSVPKIELPVIDELENPHSPSILDEALQKGIEEHLPCEQKVEPSSTKNVSDDVIANVKTSREKSVSPSKSNAVKKSDFQPILKMSFPSTITHLIITKNLNGKCSKSVTCTKNLKYSIELDGKAVELLGAPKVISSLEDLQVLLQIVNETDLENLYVYH